ncbi:ENV2 protein, partial [Dromaius novaehollandiae]|nr:ENV2 protein [Dromaius novaehollandiae]
FLKQNTLWNLMETSYIVLNHTYPNLTDKCWLCYDPKPPYYEAIGIAGSPKLMNGSNPGSCKWENNTQQGISLTEITGKGRCIG